MEGGRRLGDRTILSGGRGRGDRLYRRGLHASFYKVTTGTVKVERVSGTIYISHSTIAAGGGISIRGLLGGLVVIYNSSVQGNSPSGLNVGYAIEGGFVLAEYNWWGDPSGPYHDYLNPEGRGDAVEASPEWVDFIPWLDAPPREGEAGDAYPRGD